MTALDTPAFYAEPVQLTTSNVSSIPLPADPHSNWTAYYSTWRLRRRLIDTLARADELGVSYADLTIAGEADYLDLVKAVRARISMAIAKNAAARKRERVAQRRQAALTQSAA